MKAWIKAMRLRTLPLSFSVIIVGNAFAYGQRDSGCFGPIEEFNWLLFSLTLLTTLLLQILSNLANDYGDAKKGADNEGRIGPERAIQSGLISPSSMLRGIILTSVLSLGSGITLLFIAFGSSIDWTFITFFILGILSIAAAIKYTIGKGAYGYAGLGDLFVFIFFGMIGVVGSYYLHRLRIDDFVLLFAVTMGALSTAVLNLNNMRDRVNDAKVGKNTVVTKLGFEGGKKYHYFLFILAYIPIGIIFVPLGDSHWQVLLFLSPVFIIHAVHLLKVRKIKEPVEFDPELKKVALSTFLLALIIFGLVYFGY